MGSMNRWIGIGNLGRDAEVRYTSGGTPVATLNMACSETWKDKTTGERKEKTEWVRVNLWGPSAEALQPYLKKGKQIAVEGRLETRSWEQDGQKRYSTEIKADRVTLLGGAGNGSGGGRRDDRDGRPVEDDDEPLPF